MGIPKDLIRENKELSEWNIMTCYRGSIAHGMYIPDRDPLSIDDKDAMAVVIPHECYYLGFPERWEKQWGWSRGTKEIKRGEWDIVCYEFRKMIRLLYKSNPNVLMTLWLDRKHYMRTTSIWEEIIASRHLFATKQAYHTFSGYAHQQLHRMTHYSFEGYMGAKRKLLVEKFGYDTKNASHLIRLLRMGIEFMVEGEMHVERQDATQLLEIKRGEWSLEQVQAEASRLFRKAEDAYIHSPLPNEPDIWKIELLCRRILQRELK